MFEPKAFNNGEPKYSLQMLWPIGTDLSEIKKACKKVAKARWPDQPPKGFRMPFRDGNEEKEGEGAYKDMVFANASSQYRPPVVGPDGKTEILTNEEFYPGCWARAELNVFSYSHLGNNGVSFGVLGIQKVKDDKRLGNSYKPEFGAVPEFEQEDDGGAEDNPW